MIFWVLDVCSGIEVIPVGRGLGHQGHDIEAIGGAVDASYVWLHIEMHNRTLFQQTTLIQSNKGADPHH